MEISNNYSTAKVWNTSNKNVSKSSKKNKWKLTDSLKEKIVDLEKKRCTGQCIYWKCIYEFEKDGSKQSSPE